MKYFQNQIALSINGGIIKYDLVFDIESNSDDLLTINLKWKDYRNTGYEDRILYTNKNMQWQISSCIT
jgi:hypothetical protein